VARLSRRPISLEQHGQADVRLSNGVAGRFHVKSTAKGELRANPDQIGRKEPPVMMPSDGSQLRLEGARW